VKRRREIAAASLIVRMQNVCPCLTAVVGAKNAALRAGGTAHGGDNHDIRILRIDNDLWDPGGALEADVHPGLAGIRRLVHPVTVGAGRRTRHRVAASGVDYVGVRRSDLNRANAINLRHLVKYRIPRHTAAGRFPNPALRQANIKGSGLSDDAGDGRDTSAVIRTDVAPLQTRKQIRADLCCRAERETEYDRQRNPEARKTPDDLN